jgi:hypothetical protein
VFLEAALVSAAASLPAIPWHLLALAKSVAKLQIAQIVPDATPVIEELVLSELVTSAVGNVPALALSVLQKVFVLV